MGKETSFFLWPFSSFLRSVSSFPFSLCFPTPLRPRRYCFLILFWLQTQSIFLFPHWLTTYPLILSTYLHRVLHFLSSPFEHQPRWIKWHQLRSAIPNLPLGVLPSFLDNLAFDYPAVLLFFSIPGSNMDLSPSGS